MISKVSVVIPVYNVREYLNECVDSVINQTYSDLEIILVDDGSTDGSGDICNKYSEKDERILVIHKANGGLSDARNEGIKAATGDFILFIDSDDFVNYKMVELMIGKISDENIDIVACEYKKVTYNQHLLIEDDVEYLNIMGQDLLEELYNGKYQDISFISVCKLYRKELFEKNGINFPVGRFYEDTFTTHKLIYAARNIVIINEKLYYYRMRSGSITNSILNEKKIIDGLYADIEAVRVFEAEDNVPLMKLAYKSYCYSQYNRYIEIQNSNDNIEQKERYSNILCDGFKESRNRYKMKITLPIKYKIMNCVFLIFPKLIMYLVK